MSSLRRPVAVAFCLSALVSLTGCPQRESVITNLPGPYYHPFPVRPTQTFPPLPPRHPTPAPRPVGGTVMLDPGHGGKDAGTWPRHSTTYPEKTLVLDIAKQIGQILVARNVRVIMTRTSDVYPSLEQRSVMADRSGADLFVSIHVNSAPRNRSASGVEAHIYSQATSTSSRAAQCIVAALKRSGIETRGIRRSDFHVLREHSRPAVLMECGFLTNPQDAAALDNGAYRAKLAAAIAEGITNFLAR